MAKEQTLRLAVEILDDDASHVDDGPGPRQSDADAVVVASDQEDTPPQSRKDRACMGPGATIAEVAEVLDRTSGRTTAFQFATRVSSCSSMVANGRLSAILGLRMP
jgi:hypothetical protein